jgi:(S)-ureidoglycine aminohydrolase
MNDLFGFTRTVVTKRYALITPDGFVTSHLPGWKNAACVVNISPALGGPRFTQLHITLEKDGTGEGNTGVNQYFIYVIEGAGTIDLAEKRHRLERGSYIYLPPGVDLVMKNNHATALKLLIFQKRYLPLKGHPAPVAIVAHEREVKGQPFLGHDEVRLQVLLPEHEAFDLAVNILTYQPGATLPFVETHIMEHGMLLLKGQGIYRLGADYYPVKTGDVIWLGAYCPQWFGAMGKTPASYIYYKDVNRDPM